MLSGSRLLARMRSSGQRRSSVAESSAHAAIKCSQLSRTSMTRRAQVSECLVERTSRSLADIDHRRDGVEHEAAFGKRGELHEPDAVRKCLEQIGGDLQREPRLPRAAGTREREQPCRAEEAFHL